VIHNAIQAVAATAGRVDIRCDRDGDVARIDVIDNGPGIAREHLARVFDPFFTTKKELRGTGLGLFIARQAIEDHEGSLDIASETGQGTRVTFRLPAVT